MKNISLCEQRQNHHQQHHHTPQQYPIHLNSTRPKVYDLVESIDIHFTVQYYNITHHYHEVTVLTPLLFKPTKAYTSNIMLCPHAYYIPHSLFILLLYFILSKASLSTQTHILYINLFMSCYCLPSTIIIHNNINNNNSLTFALHFYTWIIYLNFSQISCHFWLLMIVFLQSVVLTAN